MRIEVSPSTTISSRSPLVLSFPSSCGNMRMTAPEREHASTQPCGFACISEYQRTSTNGLGAWIGCKTVRAHARLRVNQSGDRRKKNSNSRAAAPCLASFLVVPRPMHSCLTTASLSASFFIMTLTVTEQMPFSSDSAVRGLV